MVIFSSLYERDEKGKPTSTAKEFAKTKQPRKRKKGEKRKRPKVADWAAAQKEYERDRARAKRIKPSKTPATGTADVSLPAGEEEAAGEEAAGEEAPPTEIKRPDGSARQEGDITVTKKDGSGTVAIDPKTVKRKDGSVRSLVT